MYTEFQVRGITVILLFVRYLLTTSPFDVGKVRNCSEYDVGFLLQPSVCSSEGSQGVGHRQKE